MIKQKKVSNYIMAFIAVFCLLMGILFGRVFLPDNAITFLTDCSDSVLLILMFSVGISVGSNRSVFKKIKEYHIKILVIPIGIVIGSIVGGFLGCLFTDFSLKEGLAIASGLGWYSLSGVLLTELSSAAAGSVAFLSNLLREILSYLCIPWIAKHISPYAAIAPAGATSEDTTLPMIMKFTSEEIVIMSVFNGVICSLMVPILIRFFISVF